VDVIDLDRVINHRSPTDSRSYHRAAPPFRGAYDRLGTLAVSGANPPRGGRLLKGSFMAEFTAEQARENLKNVYDPEIGINIVDLGLVYDVDVSDGGDVLVTMTLTSLGCPLGPVIVQEVTNAMSDLPSLGEVDVKLVWSPAWSPEMMSEEARDELGIW
jgi:metal-sulfur cluster biosynthetic enzyme